MPPWWLIVVGLVALLVIASFPFAIAAVIREDKREQGSKRVVGALVWACVSGLVGFLAVLAMASAE